MTDHKATNETLLKLDKVSLSYGPNVILKDVCADVARNEGVGKVICFLGPSGIGNTQLSRIIAGLHAPTSGSVILRDGKPTGPGRVCMVPQNYPMFDYCSVAANLQIAGKMAGLSKADINKKATEYINTFGLGEHLGKYPKELSGGTKQRVAIVRQLMCASDYIVMDEPFSGLDVVMKQAACEAIVKLSEIDLYSTIIVVTHDVAEGMSIADTVWLMGRQKEPNTGSKIVDVIDLAGLGLAWHPDIASNPDFQKLVLDVKSRFKELK